MASHGLERVTKGKQMVVEVHTNKQELTLILRERGEG